MQVLVIACCCKALQQLLHKLRALGMTSESMMARPKADLLALQHHLLQQPFRQNYIAAPHTADAPFASNVPGRSNGASPVGYLLHAGTSSTAVPHCAALYTCAVPYCHFC